MPGIVDVFADAGIIAHQEDLLPDALDELAIRADLVGAGPLLDEWCRRRIRRVRRQRRRDAWANWLGWLLLRRSMIVFEENRGCRRQAGCLALLAAAPAAAALAGALIAGMVL